MLTGTSNLSILDSPSTFHHHLTRLKANLCLKVKIRMALE